MQSATRSSPWSSNRGDGRRERSREPLLPHVTRRRRWRFTAPVPARFDGASRRQYFTEWLFNRTRNKGGKIVTTNDRLDRTFAALADPTRRAILARLAAGEASVSELAAPFDITLPAVSKHLKVLERAGLIARSRERQSRPARLDAEPLRDVAEWAERYRSFWEESYDRLGEYLDELHERGKEKRDGRKQ
jgi:DNA-binding transcriptional ArsR family regulator